MDLLKMYFLLKMKIFQPAMLVYRRVCVLLIKNDIQLDPPRSILGPGLLVCLAAPWSQQTHCILGCVLCWWFFLRIRSTMGWKSPLIVKPPIWYGNIFWWFFPTTHKTRKFPADYRVFYSPFSSQELSFWKSHKKSWAEMGFTKNPLLGGGFKHFLFSSLPGEMIQFY